MVTPRGQDAFSEDAAYVQFYNAVVLPRLVAVARQLPKHHSAQWLVVKGSGHFHAASEIASNKAALVIDPEMMRKLFEENPPVDGSLAASTVPEDEITYWLNAAIQDIASSSVTRGVNVVIPLEEGYSDAASVVRTVSDSTREASLASNGKLAIQVLLGVVVPNNAEWQVGQSRLCLVAAG